MLPVPCAAHVELLMYVMAPTSRAVSEVKLYVSSLEDRKVGYPVPGQL